ncbi:uncharacterized protein LOC126694896 [Quercus robur]|uniref:uncharacterized protein LOC126694896 n=1 Tax=Quercus robur TaxID=38942 RepID=UPI0021626EEA|nr:uncharacterized protein LOC126694896 [Quercus robur]
MVVKSKLVPNHVRDLGDVFGILRKYRLRLNASKCSFGVGSGKFLGYLVTHRATDHVQSRSRRGAIRYIAVALHAVSLVLIREDNDTQRPIYYVSKLLHEAEIRYLPLEKAVLAIVQATRKLPHYFQAHTIVVLTQLPLRSILRSADYTSRIAKWGTILGAFDIRYMPHTAVKGQVLTDLIAKFTEPTPEGGGEPLNPDRKLIGIVSQQEPTCWKAHVDGAANQRGSGVGLVLVSPEGITIEKSLRLGFSTTNNEAEYEALLEGMLMIQKLGGKSLNMFSNSRLVVGQVNGELEARDERIQEYLVQVKRLRAHFDHFNLAHVSRSGNTHADSLAMLATSSAQPLPRVILVEDLYSPTMARTDLVRVHSIRAGPSWMDPLVLFLKHDTLPEDKNEADKIRRKTSRFWLSENSKLYKRSFSGPYLLCVHPDATELILEELHEGICGSHTGGRSLSHRAITQGYWWPSMQREAQEYVKKCDQCQRSTRETPFSMTYGVEAVIPLEINFPTQKTSSFCPNANNGLLEKSLDLIEERRESAMVRLAYY